MQCSGLELRVTALQFAPPLYWQTSTWLQHATNAISPSHDATLCYFHAMLCHVGNTISPAPMLCFVSICYFHAICSTDNTLSSLITAWSYSNYCAFFKLFFQPAGRRGEPILTGWHNLNKAALEDCSNHVSHDGTLHWLACNTSCILELCMTLFWHGVHVYMIMHTRVMYDTGSISSAADLLCCSQTQQSAIHSERDCSIKHPGKYFLCVAAE